MRGHIAKKGGRYYAVVYEGVNRTTGRGRHRWYASGTTRREAEKVLAGLIKRQHDGDYRSPERITFGTYLLERWLPVQQTRLKRSTWDNQRRNVENHVIPHLGNIPIRELQPEDIDGLYAHLLTVGRRNRGGGGLSPKTVRNVHALIRKALGDAERKGTVLRNVATLADPPRISSATAGEFIVWTAEELHQFLEHDVSAERLQPALFLAAFTGMRRAEVLGLRWRAVDLEAGRLSVQTSLVSVGYEVRLEETKTNYSRRTVDIDPRTVAVLRRWRTRQLEEAVVAGWRPRADTLVFTKPDGTWIHPDSFSDLWVTLVERSSLPRIRLHDLRHTHASTMLAAGVPVRVVSERLGHSNVAFTMNVYQHLIPGMQSDAAKLFSALVYGDGDE